MNIPHFIKGTTQTKQPIGEFDKNVFVHKGRIYASNRVLTAEALYPDDQSYAVDSKALYKALDKSAEIRPQVVGKKGADVQIKKGRALITIPGLTKKQRKQHGKIFFKDPPSSRTADPITIDKEQFSKALNAIEPFIGTDASRRYSVSALLRGKAITATNNVTIARAVSGLRVEEDILLPHICIKELLRIGTMPDAVALQHKQAVFIWDNAFFLSTLLVDGSWPDEKVLANIINIDCIWDTIGAHERDGFEQILRFSEPGDTIVFSSKDVKLRAKKMRVRVLMKNLAVSYKCSIDAFFFNNIMSVATSIGWPKDETAKRILFKSDVLMGAAAFKLG